MRNQKDFKLIELRIEDFDWEEFYLLGPGDDYEYEKLIKENLKFH